MALWAFFDYVSDIGTNHVAKWIEKELDKKEEAALDALLGVLAKKERWQQPEYLVMTNMDGLGEIRLRGRRQIRLIGLQQPPEKRFISFVACFHKESYKPHNALDSAKKWHKEFIDGKGALNEHQ